MARKRGYELGRQLTPRDQEVLALLRRGLTDAEIAASLGISRRGASYHVSQIIAKLGVQNRYEAAAWPDRPPWLAVFPLIATWRQLRRVAANVATQLSAPAAAAALVSALLGLGLIAFFIARTPHEASIQASGPTPASTARISTPPGDSSVVSSGVTVPSQTQAPATHVQATDGTPRPANQTPPLPTAATRQLETPAPTPESTPTLPSWRVISAGNGHACAITSVASLKCWGDNESGQLGDGTTNNSSTPVTVDLGLSVIDVVAANFWTCAVTVDGAVFCWGNNSLSYLLGPDIAQSSTPIKVIGSGSGVREISGGVQHVCALTSAGKVLCWGWGGLGQIVPDTSLGWQMTPLEVPGVDGVTSVVAGAYHTCVVLDSGHAKCWGDMFGREPAELLGNDGQPLVDAVQVSQGYGVCVRFSSGTVQCQARDGFENVLDAAGSPVSNIVDVQGGWLRGCVLTSDGMVKCWDDPSGDSVITAVDVPELDSGVASLGSYYGGCFMMQDGTAKCWGDNHTLIDVVGIS